MHVLCHVHLLLTVCCCEDQACYAVVIVVSVGMVSRIRLHLKCACCSHADFQQGLYLRFDWPETHQTVYTPLVLAKYGPSGHASAKWFHCCHLPLSLAPVSGLSTEMSALLVVQVRSVVSLVCTGVRAASLVFLKYQLPQLANSLVF